MEIAVSVFVIVENGLFGYGLMICDVRKAVCMMRNDAAALDDDIARSHNLVSVYRFVKPVRESSTSGKRPRVPVRGFGRWESTGQRQTKYRRNFESAGSRTFFKFTLSF